MKRHTIDWDECLPFIESAMYKTHRKAIYCMPLEMRHLEMHFERHTIIFIVVPLNPFDAMNEDSNCWEELRFTATQL